MFVQVNNSAVSQAPFQFIGEPIAMKLLAFTMWRLHILHKR